jgi:putative SOS response-associated peptidase YedK
MRWGLLPSWVEEPKAFPLLINARGESVLDKPAFRNAMRRRRCLIPTDGFYEWQAGAAGGSKQSYFVRARRAEDGAATPLAFAGLWETWTGPNGEELDTTAIVTTNANAALSAIHPRMPVFVAPENFDRWLDCDAVPAEEAATLIKPADDTLLEVYPISPAVNRVANDAEALLAPLSPAAVIEQATAPSPAKPAKRKKSDDQPTLF